MFSDEEYSESTPETRAEMDLLNQQETFLREAMQSVVDSIPQEIPSGDDKPQWEYGDIRIAYINDPSVNYVSYRYTFDEVKAMRLIGFYRQTAKRDEDTSSSRFVVTVPLGFVGQVQPGQAIENKTFIDRDCTPQEMGVFARESFLALQEKIKEFVNK